MPKVVLIFDAQMPISFINQFGTFFAKAGVELMFLNGENQIDRRWEIPPRMPDPTAHRYAEHVLGRKCLGWKCVPPALFVTRDKRFTPRPDAIVPTIKVTTGNSDEMKARMMLDIGRELEKFIPGSAKSILEELRRHGYDLSEELLRG